MRKKLIAFAVITVLIVSALTLLSCNNKVTVGEINADSVSYDGAVLKWSRVDGATSYNVTVGDSPMVSVGQSDAPQLETVLAKTTVVKLAAVNTAEKGVAVSEEKSVTLTCLSRVETIPAGNNGFSWAPVEGANCYLIEKNGLATTEVVTSCTLAYNEGSNSVRVKPQNTEAARTTFSVWSDIATATLLAAPSGFYYDGEILHWTAVNGAESYEVVIDDGEVQTVSLPRYVFNPLKKSFVSKVRALGSADKGTYNSAQEAKSFTYLEPCKNVKFTQGVMSWDPIEGVNAYDVKVVTSSGETTERVLSNSYSAFEANTSYTISVKPVLVDSGSFTAWSIGYGCEFLPAPATMWDNKTIKWNSVTGADGYRLDIYKGGDIVDHQTLDDVIVAYSGYDFSTREGIYTVFVSATCAETNGRYGSKRSEAITVLSLAAPENYAVRSDVDVDEDEIELVFNDVLYADTYGISVNGGSYVDGITHRDGATSLVISRDYSAFSGANGATVAISVESKSNVNNQWNADTRTVVLNCPSERALVVDLKKLAVPGDLQLDSNILTWNTVNGCSGYLITVTNAVTSEALQGYENVYLADTYYEIEKLPAGKYNVTVAAAGNGNVLLTGDKSSPVNFVKLPAPKNVRVDASLADTVVWDAVIYEVDNVQYTPESYRVMVGTNAVTVETNSYTIPGEYLSVTGTTVYVYSIGNNGAIESEETTQTSERSNAQGESLQLFRLREPKYVTIDDNRIFCNAVANASYYRLYDSDIQVGQKTEPLFSVDESTLEAGTHELTIRAFGESGSVYFSSEESVQKDVRLLNTPNVSLEKGTGVLSWEPVTDANGYRVVVGEYSYTVGESSFNAETELYSYTPIIRGSDNEVIAIKVYALGDNGLTSISSKSAAFTQTLKQLERVNGTIEISVDENERHKVTITIKEDTPTLGRGYEINIGGASSRIFGTNTYVYNAISAGTLEIKVRAIGGNYNKEDMICYMNSEFDENNTVIHLLEAVNSDDVNLERAKDSEGNITTGAVFNNVVAAIGYRYSYKFLDSNNEIIGVANTGSVTPGEGVTKINFENIPNDAYNVEITIVSVGDNTSSFDSADETTVTLRVK